ncbi:MAG: Ig-like domain-containing protein, partial [Paludibacteraceae bacterium]|nr:Ig-like domain-containing protein [Paludibacteraceae bacterium]
MSGSGSVTGGTFTTSSATVCEDGTATLTATPATGYEFTSWSATGTGCSLSSTTANPATLTMGTADVTVNATFSLKNYTITLNNQSATSAGTENVTTTYNSSSNLTSAITKPTKDGKVFAGYFTATNGGGVQLIDPAGNWIASAGGNSTYMDGSKNWKYDNDMTLYACWMEYANSLDLQNYVETEVGSSAGDKTTSKTFTHLTSNNYICSLSGNTELDNSDNAAYRGLKFKNSGDYILFLVPANYSLSVKWGYVKSSKPKYSINGGAAQTFTTLSTDADNTSSPGEIEISSQSYIQLVKLMTSDANATVLKEVTITSAAPSCSDDTGLAYGETTVNKVYGDASFTNTLTNSNSLSVTYSSSNTDVATVNPSTGAVTIKAAGTATITASWAGDASYCEDEVSYTLNVKPAVGEVSGTWDRFGGETISLSVTPSGGSSYSYQWKKWYNDQWNNVSNGTVSGSETSGATTNNLQITNCTKDHSGSYCCVVTSAGQTNETPGYQVKVYVLECYNGGTTVYNFTRDGENLAGSLTIDLDASTAYEFKVHADNDYYGNNGTINSDATNWVLCNSEDEACTTNLTVNSGLGGTFTFAVEYSASGNSNKVGEPEISVTYPRKRIYLDPGVWDADGAKFAYNYWRDGVTAQWTDFLTSDDCGMYADIPQWNGVTIIPARLKSSTVTPGSWDDSWNQTNDITVNSNNSIVITGWDGGDGKSTYTYGTYSTPTYTISYNAGTSGSGTKDDETKTCGVDFTLPSSAVFTREGYLQTGWTTSDGGAQTHAL